MKEMNCITKTSDGQQPAAQGEEMEPGTVRTPVEHSILYSEKAYINGNAAGKIRLSEHNISYMADYIADDEGRILSIRYDPVPF